LLLASSAFAQATRTWISGYGDDANPCSRTAPCATLAGTLPKTAVGGEVNVLDTTSLGEATITRSVSIIAAREVVGAMDEPSVTGLTINAPNGIVTLRGLTFEANQSGVSGVRVVDAAVVRLEGCRLNGFTADAVDARVSDGGLVFIDRTTVHGSLGAGLAVSSAGAPVRVVASESSFTGNQYGLLVGPRALLTVHEGVLTGNSAAGVRTVTDGGVAEVNVEGAQLTDNGLGVEALDGTVIRLSNANVMGNATSPTHVTGSGLVHSFGNNRIVGGSTSACVAGSVGFDPVVLPAGTVGVAVPGVVLGSTGGIGALTWAATGTVPSGVGVDGGVFSGVPRQTGSFALSLTATDFNGCVASQPTSWTVSCPAVTVSPTSAPQLTTGTAMTPIVFSLQGTTATAAPQFALTGTLPIGVTFVAGVLSGMPTQGGQFPVVVSAMDSYGCTAQTTLTLDVALSSTFQPTTLALSAAMNPAPVGGPATVTATLTFASGSPTGLVSFFEGATLLGSSAVASGRASFDVSALALGNHRLTALYGGDATYGGSVAPELSLDVVLAPTTTTVSKVGAQVVVEVTSAVALVDGDVSLSIDGTTTTVTLEADGRARAMAPTSVGTHTLQANYLGTSRFAASMSSVETFTVEAPVVDAGATEPDAGTMEPNKPSGCGCSSSDASLAVVGLFVLVLRRRTGRASSR
jgi:hypothetical protein